MTEAKSIWLGDCQPAVPTSAIRFRLSAAWGTDVLIVGAGLFDNNTSTHSIVIISPARGAANAAGLQRFHATIDRYHIS